MDFLASALTRHEKKLSRLIVRLEKILDRVEKDFKVEASEENPEAENGTLGEVDERGLFRTVTYVRLSKTVTYVKLVQYEGFKRKRRN